MNSTELNHIILNAIKWFIIGLVIAVTLIAWAGIKSFQFARQHVNQASFQQVVSYFKAQFSRLRAAS